MTTLRPTSGLLTPHHPTTGEGPTRRNAELTVYALGPDEDTIVPALRMLGEFSERALRQFQGSLPRTLTLPATYYARSNAFVSLLRTTGTRFSIRSWVWLCPDEMRSDDHLCKPTCMVQECVETIAS
jgi:hypothetical protein